MNQEIDKNEKIIQKYIKMQEQCRMRQKKYYDKHKETILQGRKIKRSNKTELFSECKTVFDLPTILKKLDESEIITNENTRECHKNRMKTFFEITKILDLSKDIEDYDSIIDKIDTSTYGKNSIEYKLNSKKNMLESFLFCLDKLNITLEPMIRERYQDYYLKIKMKCNDQLEDKRINQEYSVISYEDYEKKILDRFGIESKEYFMIRIYKEVTCRDDLDLYIIKDEEKHKDDLTKNYLIDNEKNYTILLQAYKTSKNKNPIKIKLSTDLDKLVNQYIIRNNIKDRIFPSKHGLNFSFINTMNKKIGMKGGINLIRHIIISSGLLKMDLDERVKMAKNSFHSISTQRDYNRQQKKTDI